MMQSLESTGMPQRAVASRVVGKEVSRRGGGRGLRERGLLFTPAPFRDDDGDDDDDDDDDVGSAAAEELNSRYWSPR